MSTDDRIVTAARVTEDVQYRVWTPAADARRVHRTGSDPREPAGLHHGGPAARRGARPRPPARPTRTRQDHTGLRHRQRARCLGALNRGAGHREARRSGGDADGAREPRGPLHRRGASHEPRHRRNPLSGDGGLRARHRDRAGAWRAFGEGAGATVHAHRRDDADGTVDLTPPRAVRHRPPPRLLRRGGYPARSWSGRRESLVSRSSRRRRPRSRGVRVAHRASPTGCFVGFATTRR